MDEVWWTLVMVVAWIVWRSSAEVTRAWDVYRSKLSYWQRRRWRVGFNGRVRQGSILKPSGPANLSLLAIKERYQKEHDTFPRDAISVEAARQELWYALDEAAVQAFGINTETGKRESIPDYKWHDLVSVNNQGRDVVRYREGHGVSGRGYDDLAFRSRSIVAKWPTNLIEERVVPAVYASGAPGRPTSINLVRAEYEARWQRNEVKKEIGAEAEVLSKWLALKHPGAPQLTAKTIRNNLGREHRQHWQDARK
jgi:hypothetical protein